MAANNTLHNASAYLKKSFLICGIKQHLICWMTQTTQTPLRNNQDTGAKIMTSLSYSYEHGYHDNNSNATKEYGYRYSSDGALAGITVDGELAYTYDHDTLGRLIHSSALEDG